MAVETLQRPETSSFKSAREAVTARAVLPAGVEPNWGPEDMHAIKAIAYLMIGIFTIALMMYGTITFFAWLGS